MDRNLVAESLKTYLASITQKNFAVVDAPSDITLPYGVIHPLDGGEGMGSFGNPEEDREWIYQIDSVGEDHRQAAWMSDRVLEAMRALVPGTIASVQAVWVVSIGAIVPSGERLFVGNDTYTVRAGDG